MTLTEEQKQALNSAAEGRTRKKSTKQARQSAASSASGTASDVKGADLVDLAAIAQQFNQVGQTVGLTAINSMHQGIAQVFESYRQHGGVQFFVQQVGDRAVALPEAAPNLLGAAEPSTKDEAIAAIEALFVEE
jgi:hypothetical protein